MQTDGASISLKKCTVHEYRVERDCYRCHGKSHSQWIKTRVMDQQLKNFTENAQYEPNKARWGREWDVKILVKIISTLQNKLG